LNKNKASVDPGNLVYADSALHLARVWAGKNRFGLAIENIREALTARFAPDSLSNAAIYTAGKMIESDLKSEASFLLKEMLATLADPQKGAIHVELGKIARDSEETEKAKKHFGKALELLPDGPNRAWVEESLSDLKSQATIAE